MKKDYTVVYNGKPALLLNEHLVKAQGLTKKEVDYIKELHVRRMDIEDSFENDEITPEEYVKSWTLNQFDLQLAWGFGLNANYHRFWDMKGCSCPKMDNNDGYPYGHYVTDSGCPVHGHLVSAKVEA